MSLNPLVIGIDCSTTACKAIAWDAAGQAVAEGRATYDLARELERVAVTVLAEVKPGRRLHANVEFYTATLLDLLGIPGDLFTCVFAIGRCAGWTAHAMEQLADNRLIRPADDYVGPVGLKWMPIDQRP